MKNSENFARLNQSKAWTIQQTIETCNKKAHDKLVKRNTRLYESKSSCLNEVKKNVRLPLVCLKKPDATVFRKSWSLNEKLNYYRNDETAYQELKQRVRDNSALVRRSFCKISCTKIQTKTKISFTEHLQVVLERKRKLVDETLKLKLQKLEAKYEYEEKKKKSKRSKQRGEGLLIAVFGWLAHKNVEERVLRTRKRFIEEDALHDSSLTIQRLWKKKRASHENEKYKKTIKTVRRFIGLLRVRLKNTQLQRKADLISWVLADIETSNFQKVVKNFRSKVVSCQRSFQTYQKVSESRERALKKLFRKIDVKLKSREDEIAFDEMMLRELRVARNLFGKAATTLMLMQVFNPAKHWMSKIPNIDIGLTKKKIMNKCKRYHHVQSLFKRIRPLPPTRLNEQIKLQVKPRDQSQMSLCHVLCFQNVFHFIHQVTLLPFNSKQQKLFKFIPEDELFVLVKLYLAKCRKSFRKKLKVKTKDRKEESINSPTKCPKLCLKIFSRQKSIRRVISEKRMKLASNLKEIT